MAIYKMPFGKYKGEQLKNIPIGYLIWLYDEDYCPKQVKSFVKRNKKDIAAGVCSQPQSKTVDKIK